jgi:alpha-D-ribose 1-methylphosphonate 5-triphosphate synthase subunit PhnG
VIYLILPPVTTIPDSVLQVSQTRNKQATLVLHPLNAAGARRAMKRQRRNLTCDNEL